MALISKLQLGQDELPFEDYLMMKGEDIIEAKYCMLELVDMTLVHKIEPPSFDLSVEPLDSLDVDDRLPPIVKLIDAQQHAQLLATFFYGEPIRIYSYRPNKTVGHIGEAQ